MDDSQVTAQLKQMVNFILQEAEEKANEILRKADEECSIERARIIRVERQKIQAEYERKEKQIDIERKIKYANMLNETRLAVLQARDQEIKDILRESQKQLQEVSKRPEYKQILQRLIIQGLTRLKEPSVSVVCRNEDKDLVRSILASAAEEYKKLGRDIVLTMDERRYLPPPPSDQNKGESCSGGVILNAGEGRIICKNTLDARLALAFEATLPKVRSTLFPVS